MKRLKMMEKECEKTPALSDAINSFYGFVQFKKDIRKELDGLIRMMPYCFENAWKIPLCGTKNSMNRQFRMRRSSGDPIHRF